MVAAAWFLAGQAQAADPKPPPVSSIVQPNPGGLLPIPIVTSVKEDAVGNLDLEWWGITPPYQVLKKQGLHAPDWSPVGSPTTDTTANVPSGGDLGFFLIEAASPNYAGASVCSGCHSEKHGHWMATRHSGALETLKAIGQGENAYCLRCHTVGFGLPNGFVDEATTPGLAGVQCENCHGPSGNHPMNPFDPDTKPKIELSAKVCGGCHTDAHHPTYDEWSLSRHSHALATVQQRNLQRCLECHNEDYRYAVANGREPLPQPAEAKLSIECATCHSSHDPQVEIAQLRKPIGMLCGECHTAGEPTLGNTPHHPQYPVLSGWGAFEESGVILTNTTSSHSDLAAVGGMACAQCHVVQHEVEEPTEGNPNVTGHTFNPFDDTIDPTHQASKFTGCISDGCHAAGSEGFLETFMANLQSGFAQRLAALEPFFDASSPQFIDPTTLSPADQERLQVASWNTHYLEADSSLGIHNPNFYRATLTVAESIVQDLAAPPLTALK